MTLALSMHACVCTDVCTCVYFCLVHVHAYTTNHTTPHHPLIRFIDSGVFTRQYGIRRAPPPYLTEQSDLNVLLQICHSLWDLLNYCWVPLGGGEKGVKLERCTDTFRCVCMQVHV